MEQYPPHKPPNPNPIGGNTADKNKDKVHQDGPERGAMRPERLGRVPLTVPTVVYHCAP